MRTAIQKVMPTSIAPGQTTELAKSMILSLINLEKRVPEWRKVNENYSNSIEQAATFMRRPSEKNKDIKLTEGSGRKERRTSTKRDTTNFELAGGSNVESAREYCHDRLHTD